MSEIFTIQCANVAVVAAQDILSATAAATKKLKILAFSVGCNGQTTAGNIPISLRYLPTTVTAGSGGAAATAVNQNPDGAAASFTARANDTTHATSSGTVAVLLSDQFNALQGNYWWQAPQDDAKPKTDLSAAFVLRLDAAPGASINLSATMWLEEI